MTEPDGDGVLDGVLMTLFLVNSVVLGMLELFFLPLRFDGLLLPDLGAIPAPFSLLVAAVTTPWLVSQTARLARRMGGPAGFAALPLALWLLTVMVLGFSGPGGDHVMPVDWRGIALLAAGALPSSLVLGRELALGRVAQRST